jgi:hypothetical protein
MSNAIDLEFYGTDAGDDFQSMEFVNDLIVTPPMSRGKDDIESNVPAAVKRNLSKVFYIVSKCHQCSFEKSED